MPGFDRTGPRGEGPMTGGGRGFCIIPDNLKGKTIEELCKEGYIGKGFFGRGLRFRGGRGRGHGRGRGRGWRFWRNNGNI